MKLYFQKYMSWLLISSLLLVLFGCNGGSSNSTPAPSSLKAISAFSFPSSNGPVNGVITGQNISVTMPFGTSVTSLISTFTTSGASVKVGTAVQTSGTTPNNFTNPVSYVVTAADGSTNTYTVTVTTGAFTAYYPSGCILNNIARGVIGTCTCIKEISTGNIWTTAGNTDDIWINWCNHTAGTVGYDANCPITSNSLDTWNASPKCGLTGSWHLPTAPSPIQASLSGTNPGGNWSSLYNDAIAGSIPPGSAYTSGGDLSVWMNNNGFQNISNITTFSDYNAPGYYWSSTSSEFYGDAAWTVQLSNGNLSNVYNGRYDNIGVVLVHVGQ